jgi:hypothetical protein
MRSAQQSGSQHRLFVADLRSNLLVHLARREVVNRTDQSVFTHPSPDSTVSKIVFIVTAKIQNGSHGIEPIPSVLEPVNLITALVSGVVIGGSWSVYPVQARVSGNDTFPKVYAEVENNVESKKRTYPRWLGSEEYLARLLLTKIRYKRTAIARQPLRDIGDSAVVQIRCYVKFGKEYTECCQSRLPLFHEIAKVLSAASHKLACELNVLFTWVSKSRRIWSLPMGRLVNGIIGERFRYTTSLFPELFWFAAQPAKHGLLHY